MDFNVIGHRMFNSSYSKHQGHLRMGFEIESFNVNQLWWLWKGKSGAHSGDHF